ncbi:zinc finger protein ZFP2-like isoform X2 [Anopheles coustani]|uniref:zinc finger protein ZFP2-like isoform X2 n=1 Tax=Anopheles coustani TaxID=139045 RepID=UPI0026596DB2|nr:zinc finger protein ZFP2-like isoform X2 [Anopheles coustani]
MEQQCGENLTESSDIAKSMTYETAIKMNGLSLSQAGEKPKIIYLDRICRTCLVEKEKDQLKDLFAQSLAEAIMNCSGVSISESDGLPCHICIDCCIEVERCFNFRQMSEQSDATIRSLIEKSVIIKQDSETKYEVLNVVLTDSDGNTETSAVVVPIEELRFQLVNTSNTPIEHPFPESISSPIAESYTLSSAPLDGTISDEKKSHPNSPEEDCSLQLNPSDLLNEPPPTPPPGNSLAMKYSISTAPVRDSRESVIYKNLKQELSEFIGNSCGAISKETALVDDNEDDEIINVDYLKDALTEEYIQNMEHQLASSVSAATEEEMEQEHLNNLIHASMEAEAPHYSQKNWDLHPENTLHCNVCDIQFTERRLYRKHVKRKHSEKRFECNHCPKKFAEKSLLKNHMLRHTGEKTHICDVCKARFYEKSLLNVHMRRHTGTKPYACDKCDKSFTTRSILTTHQKLKAHERIHTNEKPFECPYCPKRFNQNGNLVVHIRTHSGEKPFKCKLCDKAYPSQGELRGHMRQHTGEKKAKKVLCNVCNKAFPANHDLAIHMRTHTKEKPFACNVCEKRFMLHVHLTVHMRSHTGEKPFACTLCEKAFPTSYQLKMHNYVHTGEKNYACDVCNRKFSSSANRNTHRKTHDRKIS